MVAQGTPEERKAFVRTFVTEIRIHPHEACGTVRIKKIPLPPAGSNGMSSFNVVAGARVEVEKKTSAEDAAAINELLGVAFGSRACALVPS